MGEGVEERGQVCARAVFMIGVAVVSCSCSCRVGVVLPRQRRVVVTMLTLLSRRSAVMRAPVDVGRSWSRSRGRERERARAGALAQARDMIEIAVVVKVRRC